MLETWEMGNTKLESAPTPDHVRRHEHPNIEEEDLTDLDHDEDDDDEELDEDELDEDEDEA